MEQKFSKYLKETFGVIKYSPKAYFGNLICETYIIFQTIFVAVIIANIITAIESSNTENVWFWAYVFLISTILMIISTIIEDLLRQILD
jgi:hypothetical protein